jgi:hypothetical protein
MNLPLATLVVIVSVAGGISLCFYLLGKFRDSSAMLWFLEHIGCPLIRVMILLIVVSQVYPAIDGQSGSLEFWRILGSGQQFRNIVNILFIAGLLLAFLPVVGHPMCALPLQSMLTIALVFDAQYAAQTASLSLLPSIGVLLKIAAWMLLAWILTRELSIPLAHRLDRALVVSGTIRLISDALYLLLQIPVMLIYGAYLARQLG